MLDINTIILKINEIHNEIRHKKQKSSRREFIYDANIFRLYMSI